MTENGGPAFPVSIAEIQGLGTHSGEFGDSMMGMSLRDYFAGQALTGILAAATAEPNQAIAKECYAIADAMLKQRDQESA